MTKKSLKITHIIPWLFWLLAALFYCYVISVRILPSTMAGAFMHHFKLNGVEFGGFTALFYYSYTVMQIPCGLLVDRYSLRLIISCSCLISAFGLLITALATNIEYAGLGRLLMGFGCAFGYVSALKTAAISLPEKYFGIATCCTDSLGMLAAIVIDVGGVYLKDQLGMKNTQLITVGVGILLALIIITFLRDNRMAASTKKIPHIVQKFKLTIRQQLAIILRNKQIWLIGIVGCLYYLPSSIFLDVWGIPYLEHVYHLTDIKAAKFISMFTFGWVIASPLFGLFSDKMQNRKMPVIISIIMITLLFSVIVFPPYLFQKTVPTDVLALLLLLIGIFTASHPLIFPLAKEEFSHHISGTVVAITNTLVMLGGIIFQPAFGYLLDFHKKLHHLPKIGAHVFYSNNYTFAMAALPVLLLISLIVAFFIKEANPGKR